MVVIVVFCRVLGKEPYAVSGRLETWCFSGDTVDVAFGSGGSLSKSSLFFCKCRQPLSRYSAHN